MQLHRPCLALVSASLLANVALAGLSGENPLHLLANVAKEATSSGASPAVTHSLVTAEHRAFAQLHGINPEEVALAPGRSPWHPTSEEAKLWRPVSPALLTHAMRKAQVASTSPLYVKLESAADFPGAPGRMSIRSSSGIHLDAVRHLDAKHLTANDGVRPEAAIRKAVIDTSAAAMIQHSLYEGGHPVAKAFVHWRSSMRGKRPFEDRAGVLGGGGSSHSPGPSTPVHNAAREAGPSSPAPKKARLDKPVAGEPQGASIRPIITPQAVRQSPSRLEARPAGPPGHRDTSETFAHPGPGSRVDLGLGLAPPKPSSAFTQ